MADTIREQIISAYLTRLSAWRTSGGFNHDCGASVLRAVQYVDEKDLPVCVLFPKPEEAATNQYGISEHQMPVRVEGLVAIGAVDPSVIQEQLLGDMIKLMTDPAVAVTSKIKSIQYTGGGPNGTPTGEDTSVAAYAEFTIIYTTLKGNPYSQ
ncbi:hypothetical protein [Desulfotignum balticum]|uniref:hypothetical protein n=1 Tax=Desulfotignum balticum TaxID=115781 RepID=UPI0004068C4A|nr:hypothetical protein [Desulfotignum balticum]